MKALRLHDSDLDRFATYFELTFRGSSRGMTVLVALLQRLRAVGKGCDTKKHTGIWLEDIVSRLTQRLYGSCQPGWEAATRLGTEASDVEEILSEGLASFERVVIFRLRRADLIMNAQ